MRRDVLSLAGGVEIESLSDKAGAWLGLGAVRVGGIPLRDGHRPIVLRLDTPDGWLYTRYELLAARSRKDGTAEVRLRAVATPWGLQEYQDEYNQQMLTVGMTRETAADELVLRFEPAALRLAGREWHGFSWSFRFRGGNRRIHRILVDGTWELGGRIVGNTVLSQGQCNRPVYRGAKGTLFTTTCLKTLDQYGSPQGVSYQLGPRGGLVQGFDFQHGKLGMLFLHWRRYTAVASVIESPRGDTHLHVLDEYRFPLAANVRTTPHVVLFTPGRAAEHEARDAWWEAREFAYGAIRARFGLPATPVRPESGLKYTTCVTGGRLRMTVGGVEVDSHEVPYAIAEHVLPRLAKAGVTRFFPEVMSESDVTVLGMQRKLDGGVHGDLHCASVCATHRFLPAEFWGGMKGWKAMAGKARRLGIELGAWFAPHFSPRAAIFGAHPEWILRDANSLPASGGYGIHSIVAGDWNTGLFDWVLADIRRWRDEGGLDYVFTDSWANLGLVQRNYAAGMRTNHERLGALYGEFARLGLRSLSFEGISPFGFSRIGVADPRSGRAEAVAGIVGQNDFAWWVGEEDMGFGLCLAPAFRARTDAELRKLQFRFMAGGGYLMPDPLLNALYEGPAWIGQLNRVLNQALPHMKARRLLPGGAGVRWTAGETTVLWAFKDVALEARGEVERLTGTGVERVPTTSGRAVLPAWGTYRVDRLVSDSLTEKVAGTVRRGKAGPKRRGNR